MLLEQVTKSNFVGCLGEKFGLQLNADQDLEIELASVDSLDLSAAPPTGQREPFSLVFITKTAALLPQQIYRLEHKKLGTLDIFLVPIGPDPQGRGMRMEAVFN